MELLTEEKEEHNYFYFHKDLVGHCEELRMLENSQWILRILANFG